MIGRRLGLKNLQIMPMSDITKRKNKQNNKNCKSSTCSYVHLDFQNLIYYNPLDWCVQWLF